MLTALVLAIAAGTAATTITKAKAFQWLRLALKARSKWLGYLVSCPYCTSHWLVFALQAVYQLRLVQSSFAVVDVVVSSFVVIGAAAFVSWALRRAHDFAEDPNPFVKQWDSDAEHLRVYREHLKAARS